MAASLGLRSRAVTASAPIDLARSRTAAGSGPALFPAVLCTKASVLKRRTILLDQGKCKPQRHVLHRLASEFTGQGLSAAIRSDEASHKQRFVAVRADGGESVTVEKSKAGKWDALTTQLAASSTAAFLVSHWMNVPSDPLYILL